MLLKNLLACALLFGIAASSSAVDENDKPVAVGEKAPDFTLTTTTDKKIKLSELLKKGPAVVVVLRGNPGYQ